MGRRNRSLRGVLGAALCLLAAGTIEAPALALAQAPAPTSDAALRDVLLVGNSAAGTVSFLDGHTFANLGSFNVVPDLRERLAAMNPLERAAYEVVRQQEGGDRFADDLYVSPDGRRLYVSRGNLDDVAAFDLASRRMLWRFKVDGVKADHAALSPDGTRLVVSATTAQKAQVLDTATGQLVAGVPTGTYPHANDYSANGTHVYNASIGVTALPKALNPLKGRRQLTVFDARTFRVLRTYQFGYGIRPAVITPDERLMYAQLSYLNGFVEYDLVAGRITRTVTMPFSPAGAALDPDRYPNNSAHHGMAMSGDGTALCDVGTIDDYTAIVARPALTTTGSVHYPTGSLPYWSTTTVDGQRCAVSLSNAGAVSIVDYATAREVARVPVGAFPQRERLARVAGDVLATLSPAPG
jgi:DNA-binding beta-propeller fold protein YncE